ncbi:MULTISPECIES: cytochrome P450 [Streptomyces]|uniref:Cytochrome P450 n=3 Tax=Streptomyces TaxID=1883 RepID=A0ABS9JJP8_9ACTN|nr:MULTISPECIES: cytochrome P450 [Streptomyces]MYU26546.1 cytochrome P450 [Streptomyces sp. SID7810]CUW25359.1 Cytochrome P450-SU1 [Streptomyces reticuli]MCG0065799.1 cytochrome P450 [Streptomyces tricolor]OYP13903.1 cytochrome P450 [Streptomyces sp. FBKL.4005]BCM71117.1 putative cytochrome P450 [Streptomyces sp. EAS-AB2608]
MSEMLSYEEVWSRTHHFDPPAIFDKLREERPLARMSYPDGHIGWFTTSHRIAREVLSDPRFSHSLELGHFPVTKYGGPVPPFPALPGMFIHMDPPDHTRFRRMLAPEFTVRRIAELAPRVESVAAEQIEEMRAHGAPADLLGTFAKPLVLRILSDLVGLPYEERERYADAPAITHDPDGDAAEAMAVYEQVGALIGETIERKRKQPGDDIISRLLAAGELTDEELGNIVALLLFAGYETTESALSVGVMALLHHPEQLAALRADLSRIDAAVEEILRYVTVNQYEIFRAALEDVELDGQLVKKGETVTVSLPAANRDPAKYGCPADLDLGRDTAGHLAFGHGIHQCIGQNLARLELRTGLRALLQAFPDLRAATPAEEVPLRTRGSVFGLKSLPVSW